MIEFEPLGDEYPGLEYACRGEQGCGSPILGEDRERHREYHARLDAIEAATSDG
jgi:hypothetical protein